MKSIKIYYKFCLQITIFIYLLNHVQLSKSQLLANLLASNKPIHPATTNQQTARSVALNAATLNRADFKQPKLDKRNVWTPISNLNHHDNNQTSKATAGLPTTTPASSARVKPTTTSSAIRQKSQVLTDMLKAKLQEGRLAKKSLVDVDLPESNLRLVFDLNNLDKLQTQQTQESSQKLQKSVSKTNSKSATKSTASNLVAGTKGGVKGGSTKGGSPNKGELKSVREQLRLLNHQNSNSNKTTTTSSNATPQHFHIGYIRASDLRKVINSGFSVNDLPTEISNNQTERPIAARLIKPGPAKVQSKTSPAKANLEENDLETISQKDISQKLTLEKKATRKAMISPKQAHFGLRDKKTSANLIADTKTAAGKTSENETSAKAGATKSGTKTPRAQQQQAAGTKGGKCKLLNF